MGSAGRSEISVCFHAVDSSTVGREPPASRIVRAAYTFVYESSSIACPPLIHLRNAGFVPDTDVAADPPQVQPSAARAIIRTCTAASIVVRRSAAAARPDRPTRSISGASAMTM